MSIQSYLDSVNRRFKSGISREHSYRGDLEGLIRELVVGIEITNEPSNVTDCGNPDYVIIRKKIPVGYIEAKDIGKDLKSKQYKEQFDRYKKALDNLIITDYIWFQFFQHGELMFEIRIGEIENNSIKPIPENFIKFENLIKDFCIYVEQTIKSSKKLAEMMAGKARLLQNIMERALTSDEENEQDSSLKAQYETFKTVLLHDLKPKSFADIYAQSLAYGMFAARLHDKTLEDFSRQEAAELIPKSNPFLRKLFAYIAGPDIDERIKQTVDNLADVFRASDVNALLQDFGKSTQTTDPIIHFYETFLAEYDKKLRKSRGVYYTPQPVVNFIVRAVDDILKTEFNLPQGLADTSKTQIKVPGQKKKLVTKEVHKVQILDPATGTGTFLSEVVKHIYNNNFKSMQGAWSSYVEEHLIPRLNGFEILMASYSMAHLKLDMLLQETGYKTKKNQRFHIYLTNSLEEHHPDTGTLFSQWLSREANEANHIKRDTPVMCIIGNPPYAVSSSNKGKWISDLLKDYKKDLNERNIQPLSDDYIKFIRYGQYFIEKNGEGILAYISNNSFIDGRIHRQIRKTLLETFDDIYILDLHGNSKKKEVCPDGTVDKNVFDIMQGVSINIFIKKTKSKKFASINHFDLYGKRNDKYNYLSSNSMSSINWNSLKCKKPYFFFVPKDFRDNEKYLSGFLLSNFLLKQACGIVSARDNLLVNFTKKETMEIVNDFIKIEEFDFRNKYKLPKDSRDWTYSSAKNKIESSKIIKIDYRPFDLRYIPYSPNSKGVISYPRNEIMKHMISTNNIGLLVCKQQSTFDFQHVFITKIISDKCTLSSQTKEAGYHFPLYLYPVVKNERKHNLNMKIIDQIIKKLGLTFTSEKEKALNTFAPIDMLDYIYAVLHSPSYREKYKEFFKIDFPRVPYPKDAKTFWKLVKMGGEIRTIHLLESSKVNEFITTYPKDGDNKVTRKMTKTSIGYEPKDKISGKVWINDKQYFDNVPLIAWEFYIGGYQPAQKWLKDRSKTKRTLTFEDILHYQKIIVALTETDRIMKEIDKIEIE
jgi:predicted helicase